jgi:hypothetical protein
LLIDLEELFINVLSVLRVETERIFVQLKLKMFFLKPAPKRAKHQAFINDATKCSPGSTLWLLAVLFWEISS